MHASKRMWAKHLSAGVIAIGGAIAVETIGLLGPLDPSGGIASAQVVHLLKPEMARAALLKPAAVSSATDSGSLTAAQIVQEADDASISMNAFLGQLDSPPSFQPNTVKMIYNYAKLTGPCDKKIKERSGIFESDQWGLINGANDLETGFCTGNKPGPMRRSTQNALPSSYNYTSLIHNVGEKEALSNSVSDSSHGEATEVYASTVTGVINVYFSKPNTETTTNVDPSSEPVEELILQPGHATMEKRY